MSHPLEFGEIAVKVSEEQLTRWDHFGGEDILEECLATCNSALEAASVNDSHSLSARWNIVRAVALRLRFERDGVEADIELSQSRLESIVASAKPESLEHALALFHLGRTMLALYDYNGSQYAMSRFPTCFQQAAAQFSAHSYLSSYLQEEMDIHLGFSLHCGRTSGEDPGWARGSDLITSVIQRLHDSDPLRPTALSFLSRGMRLQNDHETDASAYLDRANRNLQIMRAAVAIASTHRLLYRFILLQARAIGSLISIDANPQHIQDAIALAERALSLTPPSRHHDFSFGASVALARLYRARYESEGARKDLDYSISHHRLATQLDRGGPYQHSNLSSCLLRRFEESGQRIDVDDAVESAQSAVDTCTRDGFNDSFPLINLAEAYSRRFFRDGDVADYDMATRHYHKATASFMRRGLGEMQGACLYGLASLSSHQFQVIPDTEEELSNTIEMLCAAESLCSVGQQHLMPKLLSARGQCLAMRFDNFSGALEDLRQSIADHEAALRFTAATATARHLLLWRYSFALCLRFKLSHSDADSENASKHLEEAVRLAQHLHHPKQVVYTAELGSLFELRYRRHRRPADHEYSFGHYMRAASIPHGLVSDRLEAAVRAAQLAAENGPPESTTRAYSLAISLLPEIAWLGLTASHRYAKLSSSAGQLACDAAASAVTSGELERAVELLEEGRAVVWRSVLDLRADLKDLNTVAPHLAAELLTLGQALGNEDLGIDDVPKKLMEVRSQRRRRMAERWDMVLNEIRHLEGFRSFLRSLSFSELRWAALDGPVVLLNVSEQRSDALIVTYSEPVRCIPLAGLDHSTVRQLVYLVSNAQRVAKDEGGCHFFERALLQVARKLWHGGMSDVASAVAACQQISNSSPPRVWWIPTGPLSLLPIHCAGPYEVTQKGISDLFISSYSTTLSALLHARAVRARSEESKAPHPTILAVAQPDVPGFSPLFYVQQEMETVFASTFASACFFLYGDDATVQATATALPSHNWFHCCSHATWNADRPLDSAFYLKGGPLTLSAIIQMRLTNVAFLSACHTATPSVVLPDESMHLAAGMQVAGFRGVLATLWSMADRDGPALVEQFYHWLTVDGRRIDARNAAEALHRSVVVLRGRGVPLYRWACFVHFGL